MNVTASALRALLHLPPAAITRLAGPLPSVNGVTLDPSVHMLLWLAERIGGSRAHDVELRRAGMRENTALVMPTVDGVQVSKHVLAGRIQARAYRAHDKPAPLLMYLHGGGWVVGDLDTHDGTCRMLALHSGCIVVSVEYVLAPEHPFPAGLEDAVTAFDTLSAEPEAFGARPGPVAVAGDSAGANLCASLCLQRRPFAAGLIYPAVDLRMTMASIDTFGDGFFLTREDMLWYRDQYLPDPALITDPRVSPLLAGDLGGFPPTAVWTAGFDPLVDEGEAFAARLREAGIPTEYRCLPDQVHGFLGMGALPGGMARIAGVGRQLGRVIASATRDD